MSDYRRFWGDLHHNTYQFPEPRAQVPSLDDVLADVSRHLDFYTGAYYTACMRHAPLLDLAAGAAAGCKGTGIESWKGADRLDREWTEFQNITRRWNHPGAFVAFPGYEWQGDGTTGDHNVVGKAEGFPIHRVATVTELYARLRGGDFIAIPHHTAYAPAHRSPAWEACDESLTPFSEIHSTHGCSETDEGWVGLRNNVAMGPGTGKGTYEAALERGLHLGAIASSDNWSNVPGMYGDGLAACLAKDLTREALWEAFLARRVYAVTGDRIGLDFSVNDACMGSRLNVRGTRRVRVRAEGEDAIDRIELLRNGRVVATHCHQGTWAAPTARCRFKIRVEVGWGPRPGTLPMPDRQWQGRLSLTSGRFIGAQVYRVSPRQGKPDVQPRQLAFELTSRQVDVQPPKRNSCVVEVEADPAQELTVAVNGVDACLRIADLMADSRILWYRDETYRRVNELLGVARADIEREDLFYHVSPKVKIHRAIPEAGFVATLDFEDSEPLASECHYRVRVEQRNGQRAWSSPIWVKPG